MLAKAYLVTVAVLAVTFHPVYPDGFNTVLNGTWVLDVSDFELPWAEAVAFCRSRNTTLLTVDSKVKDQTLVNLFMHEGTSNVSLPGNNSWIAALENREGAWEWESTGEPLYYHRWYIGQPDDLTSLNCAYAAVQGLLYWRDANCSAPMYFICESQSEEPGEGNSSTTEGNESSLPISTGSSSTATSNGDTFPTSSTTEDGDNSNACTRCYYNTCLILAMTCVAMKLR